MAALHQLLGSAHLLIGWGILVLLSVGILLHDLKHHNSQMVGLMKWVWIFSVFYSGPLGLAIYYYSGLQADQSGFIMAPRFPIHSTLLFRLWRR